MQLSPSVSPIAPKSLVNFPFFSEKAVCNNMPGFVKAVRQFMKESFLTWRGTDHNSTNSPSQCRLPIPQKVTCFSKTTSPLHAVIIFSSPTSCFHGSSVYSAEWTRGHLVILASLTSPEDIRISYCIQFLAHTEWQHSSATNQHFLILLPFWCHTFLGLAHLGVTLTYNTVLLKHKWC